MTYDKNNIFNKIIHKEIPAHIIYEDEHSLAFMDIMPQVPGHVLVICKECATNLEDVSTHALSHLIHTVKMLAPIVAKSMGKAGFQIRQYNGKQAGQTVFHLHFHIIPLNDQETLKGHAAVIEDDIILKQQATHIKAALQ